MAVTAGVTSTFGAALEDNGNPIALPSGSSFFWSTDDATDTIAVSADTTSADITVTGANTSRTTLTVTADTTAPDGSDVSGSLTVPIVPGVTHTYTVSIQQLSLRTGHTGGGTKYAPQKGKK